MSPDARKSRTGLVPRPSATAGLPHPVPTLTVDAVEVVQVVQDLNHTVPLIAGKHTLVRIYLTTNVNAAITIQGTLAARRVGRRIWTQVPSVTSVVLPPASAGTGLRLRRETLNLSLNFSLPLALLAAGEVEVALAQ